MMFDGLPHKHFSVIYADPPWKFLNLWQVDDWAGHRNIYATMTLEEIMGLRVADLAADDCALFIWGIWVLLPGVLEVIESWGFKYKSCAFDWMKANAGQLDMFRDDADVQMGMGYWTRANTEFCLLATRGKPQRLSKNIRQGIIEPRREHSRKPDCVYERIERLVAGPYLELFARNTRPGWTSWGNQVGKFQEVTT